jgi:hypothetical protein
MICWVRPDYLGDPEEFRKEFAEPINNGKGCLNCAASSHICLCQWLSTDDDVSVQAKEAGTLMHAQPCWTGSAYWTISHLISFSERWAQCI